MGYRITYEQRVVKADFPVSRTSNSIRSTRWIYSAVVCVILVALLSSGSVRRHLLPGDPLVTERALGELITDLREGESVPNAVTAFCRMILDNA